MSSSTNTGEISVDTATLDSLRIVLDPIGQAGIAIALMLVMFGVALGLGRGKRFRDGVTKLIGNSH